MDKWSHYDFKITQLLLFLCIMLLLRNSAQGAGPCVTQKVHNPLISQDFPEVAQEDNYIAYF